MLYLASALRRFRGSHVFDDFYIIGFEHLGYAAHMGFFRAFGPSYGKEPGEATGSSRYLPLTCLTREDVDRSAKQQLTYWQQVVEDKARRLAKILLQKESGEEVDTVTYALRELLRNVFEHSGADELWFCGQYWPTRDTVELAVLDEGKGIRQGLAQNPYLDITTDYDALKCALLPGVSGTVFQGRRAPRDDPWANSGYGLYMTSQLCRGAGAFRICSGSACLTLDDSTSIRMPGTFDGTAICMRYMPSKIEHLTATLGELSREGERIARAFRGANISPSAASKFLRERRPPYR
jgi:hypothetical protein